MALDRALKRKVLVLASLSGPALFLFAVAADRKLPRSNEWIAALSVVLVTSVGALVLGAVAIWIFENPAARMHTHEGLKRLSLLALIVGPIWAAAKFIGGLRFSESPAEVVSIAVGLSLVAWFVTNGIGWVVDGFRSKN